MNPLLGLAFGALLVKVLFSSPTRVEPTDSEREADERERARRKARRAKRMAAERSKNSNPDPGSKSGDQPAT